MALVEIPTMAELGSGINWVAEGACEMASGAVQDFVTNPSVAETGLSMVASQIEVLEQLVQTLREVGAGIEDVHGRLTATHQLEWHSPAGNAFRHAVGLGQERAKRLEETAMDTALLASQSVDELRIMISALQSLLAAGRAALGDVAGSAVGQVCS
ncbi:MAG: hypothetical protein HLX51_09045 [Micrococcaceae bacterium]|nr:hypothetical protein [Micrococcaceae bacterium]